MDLSTVVGLLIAAGLTLWAIVLGGSLNIFIDVPSFLIVGGGALGAALTSFPFRNVFGTLGVIRNCFFTKPADPLQLIRDLVSYAEVARRDGILSLETMTKDIKDNFMVTGIQMAVDGTDPELLEQILNRELEAVADRHADGKAVFDNIAKYAPAYGMIGTLVGLVQMLTSMDHPSRIGSGMAVALLTTLYGSLAANMFALPLSEKLSFRSQEELRLKQMVIQGVLSIQSGDNPRVVERKLKIFLPHRLRAKATTVARAA